MSDCFLEELQQMLDAVKTIQPVDVPSQELKAHTVKTKSQFHKPHVVRTSATVPCTKQNPAIAGS